ncbi:MAG: hypothetical protein RLZZ308_341 [Candidatus Parcubacteria bacterium]|jgi:uncharacterized membrane protein YbaN (DUF454 family)
MILIRKLFHIAIGSLLFVIGIAGLVLPILNGVIFIVIGLIILSFEIHYIERSLGIITKKNKHIYRWHIFLDKKIRKIFRKIDGK